MSSNPSRVELEVHGTSVLSLLEPKISRPLVMHHVFFFYQTYCTVHNSDHLKILNFQDFNLL